jgi:hypothetical protein
VKKLIRRSEEVNSSWHDSECYWLCYETKQAIHVAERADNDWFRNVVSKTIFIAFCEAHFGRRMTISIDDPSDVIAYTKWTYENVQRQFEKVAGHRMRSVFPFILGASINEAKCILARYI